MEQITNCLPALNVSNKLTDKDKTKTKYEVRSGDLEGNLLNMEENSIPPDMDNKMLRIHIENLQRSVDELKASNNTLKNANKLLNDQVQSDILSKNAKLTCENAKLRMKVADLEKAATQTQSNETKTRPQSRASGEQKDSRQPKTGIPSAKARGKPLGSDDKLKSLQATIAEQKTELTTISSRNSKLKEEVSNQDKEITRLKSANSRFPSEKKDLEEKLRCLKKQVTELETLKTEAKSASNKSEQTIKRLENDIAEMKSKNAKLNMKNAEQEKTIRKQQEELQDLRNRKELRKGTRFSTPRGAQEKKSFYVANSCKDFNDGNDFDVTLMLYSPPTIGELRTAIAQHMKRSPADVQIEREVAKWRGRRVYSVGVGEYADATGATHDYYSIEHDHREVLEDDTDVFQLVKNRKNFICVTPGTPFYVVNGCADFNDKKPFNAHLKLSRNTTVGEVRTALAKFMNRDPEMTKLARLLVSCNGKNYYAVNDDEGDLNFADTKGNFRNMEDLDMKKDVLLKDDDPFPTVRGLDNHLYVNP